MYLVSQDFIDYSRSYGRQQHIKLTVEGNLLNNNDIYQLEKAFEGDILRTIMQTFEGELKGYYELKGQIIQFEYGLSLGDSETEWIDFGEFIVKETELIVLQGNAVNIRFKAYDKMLLTHKLYDAEEMDLEYPTTMYDLYTKICEVCDIETDDLSIPNGEIIVNRDVYVGINGITYRDILDEIARASGGGIIIVDNKMKHITIPYNKTADATNTLSEHSMRSLSILERMNPINVVNLTREPQHDNYPYPQDFEEIPLEDRNELIFPNVLLMDDDREYFAPNVFNQVQGMNYYTFESDAVGSLHFHPLDFVSLEDLNGQQYNSLMTNSRIVITSGISEEIYTEIPKLKKQEYASGSDIQRAFSNVYIKVDKQELKITQLIEDVGDQGDRLTLVETTADGIDTYIKEKQDDIEKIAHISDTIDGINVQITTVGGNNLLRNSVGNYNTDWVRTYNGSKTEEMKSYTDTDIKMSTVSGQTLYPKAGSYEQHVTVPSGDYIFTFKTRGTDDLNGSANIYVNETAVVDGGIDVYNQAWVNHEYLFSITENTIDIKIDVSHDDIVHISDMLLLQGHLKQVWTPANGESILGGVKIGRSIEITSNESNIMQKIDNDGNRIINISTNEVVAEYTDKGLKTKDIEAESAQVSKLLIRDMGNQTWITRL